MSQPTLLVFPDNERWKNVFSFDHAMAHRAVMSVMGPLSQWSAMPYYIDPMHYDDRQSGPWHFRHQQAHSDFSSYLPAYPTVPPPAGVILQGYIEAVVLVSGGQGYANPILTINTTTGSGAVLQAIVDPGQLNTIVQINVLSPGQGYAWTDTLTITDTGAGSGAEANLLITATNIAPGPSAAGTGIAGPGIPVANILVDSALQRQDSQSWWTFANHQEHLTAINAIAYNRQVPTAQLPWWALPPRQSLVFW